MDDNKKPPKIALLQASFALGDKAANLAKVEALLKDLPEQVDLACLPELFNTGYNLDELGKSIFDLGESIPDGETTQRLAEMARRFEVGIAAGLIECAPQVTGLLYDTVVLIDRQGKLAGRYRKSHLYPAENNYFRPGGELPVFEVDGLRVGVAICFEAAFPPIFSTLALKGAELILNPSAIPVHYEYLQDLRTRARAQDNQYFVAAINHVGHQGKVAYCGRSQVANPRGEVINLAPGDREEVLIVELDMALVRDQRIQEPVLRGFRPELYRFST